MTSFNNPLSWRHDKRYYRDFTLKITIMKHWTHLPSFGDVFKLIKRCNTDIIQQSLFLSLVQHNYVNKLLNINTPHINIPTLQINIIHLVCSLQGRSMPPYGRHVTEYASRVFKNPLIVQWFWLHSVVPRLLGSCGVRTGPQYPWLAILCDWIWQSFRWDWTNRGSVSHGTQRI